MTEIKSMKINFKLHTYIFPFSLILFCSLLLVTSCKKRPVKLNRNARKAIDSIAAKEIKILRLELDSICAQNFEGLVIQYMDSIRLERLREIKDLIK